MTRSSERLAGRSLLTSAPVGWFTAAILTVISVGALWLAVTRGEGRALNLTIAAMLVPLVVLVVLGQRRDRARWRTGEIDGRPAWELRLGAGGESPAAALVLTAFALGLGLGGVMSGSPGVLVVLGVAALLLAVLAAEMWAVWLRRPALLASADALRLRGPGIDAELAWDDVGTVEHRDLGTRWAAIVVTAVDGASSYRYRIRRLLLPMDRVPDPPGLAVRVGLVPDSPRLLRLLQEMHAGGRSARETMLARGLPDESVTGAS